MNSQLIAEYDAALAALESFADLAGDPCEAQTHFDHDAGTNAWLTRWLHHPLTLLRVFDSLYAGATAALSEVSLEIALLRERLVGGGPGGGKTEDDALAKRAADLLCHEADLHARVGRQAEERILTARTRALRMLREALKRVGLETSPHANESVGDPAKASEAWSRVETYRRLAEDVHAAASALDAPVLPSDLVARLRRVTARRPGSASGGSRAPGSWVAATAHGLFASTTNAHRRL